MLILRFASQIFSFSALIILTRMLGPTQYGIYSYIISVMLFASLFNIFGFNDVMVREILSQPDKRNEIYRSGVSIKLILGAVGYVTTEFIVLKFNLFPVPTWVSLTIGLTIFTSFTMGSVRMIWDVPYQIDFRMVSASLFNLFSKGLFFILIIGIISWNYLNTQSLESYSFLHSFFTGSFPGGVSIALVLLIIAEFSGLFVQAEANRRYLYSMIPMWDSSIIRNLVHEIWPMAISGALLMLISRINIWMIRWFLSDHDVGLFAAPMQMVEALYIIPTVIMATTLPILSKSFRHNQAEFKQTLIVISKLMLLIYTAIAGIISFHSDELIQILFGSEFTESSSVMSIYIWNAMMVCGVALFHSTVIAVGRQRWLMVSYAVHLIYLLALNLYLIPRYGIIGAAGGFLASYGLLFVSLLFIPKINFIGKIWISTALLPVTVAILIGWATSQLQLGLWISIPVIPIILGGVLFASGWFPKSDIAMVKKLLQSRGMGRK